MYLLSGTVIFQHCRCRQGSPDPVRTTGCDCHWPLGICGTEPSVSTRKKLFSIPNCFPNGSTIPEQSAVFRHCESEPWYSSGARSDKEIPAAKRLSTPSEKHKWRHLSDIIRTVLVFYCPISFKARTSNHPCHGKAARPSYGAEPISFYSGEPQWCKRSSGEPGWLPMGKKKIYFLLDT